jgi:hypothetical protein
MPATLGVILKLSMGKLQIAHKPLRDKVRRRITSGILPRTT